MILLVNVIFLKNRQLVIWKKVAPALDCIQNLPTKTAYFTRTLPRLNLERAMRHISDIYPLRCRIFHCFSGTKKISPSPATACTIPIENIRKLLKKSPPQAMSKGYRLRNRHDESATHDAMNAHMNAEAYTPPVARQTLLVIVVILGPSSGPALKAYTNLKTGQPRNCRIGRARSHDFQVKGGDFLSIILILLNPESSRTSTF